MSIVIFAILLTSSMSYGDAAENSNKGEGKIVDILETSPEIPVFRRQFGKAIEQDPNNPKYQAMAEELVYQHLRIKKGEVKQIIVNKVTEGPIEGLLTTIEFNVVFKDGETLECGSEIWEKPWENFKDVKYHCGKPKFNPYS